MTEAEKLFSETFARSLQATAIISNFRDTFTAVTSSANKHLEHSATEVFRRLHEDPQWKGILVDIESGRPASAGTPATYQTLGKTAAQQILSSSYASLDAAVLMFSHSLLDASAFDYCRVTMLHAPRDWEQDVRNMQVQLVDARDKSYDQLLQAKLDDRLEKLERESLLTKVDRLFARCNPPPDWSPMRGYAFDRGRIKLFDDQRHEIVHGNALGEPLTLFPVSEKNLNYVHQTALFFMGLVNFRYQLRVDPSILGKSAKREVQGTSASTAEG